MILVTDIPKVVAKIKAKVQDPEAAHAMEDALYEAVMSTIARCRKIETARALANAVVMARAELSNLYERWYG